MTKPLQAQDIDTLRSVLHAHLPDWIATESIDELCDLAHVGTRHKKRDDDDEIPF